jgi:hypothetical protein
MTKSLAKPVTKPARKTPISATKTQTADAGPRTAVTTTSFAAAGSVIVLADGIVANATMAQIQPPADGFAFER